MHDRQGRRGAAASGKTRRVTHGVAGQARVGGTGQRMTARGSAWTGLIRSGAAVLGTAGMGCRCWECDVRQGEARQARQCTAGRPLIRRGLAWHGRQALGLEDGARLVATGLRHGRRGQTRRGLARLKPGGAWPRQGAAGRASPGWTWTGWALLGWVRQGTAGKPLARRGLVARARLGSTRQGASRQAWHRQRRLGKATARHGAARQA